MIRIELNNNKFRVRGDMDILNKIYEDMKVKHPNAYYLRPYMERGWDGKIKYLSDAGYARTGLLPMVINLIKKYKGKYKIIDLRKELEFNEIPLKVKEFEARDYQIEAVENIIYNEIDGLPFQRGIIGAAVNAGKTLIAAMVYKSFPEAKALILINNRELYNQFMDDMPLMFGREWGYMQGQKVKWEKIMICMTPTLRNNLERYSSKLAKYNMVIFDECHLITSKTNKKVITALYNTAIRIGLSGTPFNHKDPTKNMDVRAFFGEEVYNIKSVKLMDMGYSTPVVIKIIKGNTKIEIKGDYDEEYKQGITRSQERMEMSLQRAEFYLRRGYSPILVVGRYHDHVENLYDNFLERFGGEFKVEFIHHKIKNRKEILDAFKKGKIDILISSLIVKLGQNMPLIKYMQNAAGGDSAINALQLVGRAIRIHKSKEKVYYEDMWDMGYYLQRHSRHRVNYYKQEDFKIIFFDKEIEQRYYRYNRDFSRKI